MITAVAPKALGLSTEGPTSQYFGAYNQVEVISFVGMTTVILALAAVAIYADDLVVYQRIRAGTLAAPRR